MMTPLASVILFSAAFEPQEPAGGIRFTEVSAGAGVRHVSQSCGLSVGDIDQDGWPDLWVGGHTMLPRLFRNQQDGTFVEAPIPAWVHATLDLHGAGFADFDRDGDQDLIVLAGARRGTGAVPNWLLIREATAFVDRARDFALDCPEARGRTPLWLDWNGDGRLDLLSVNKVRSDGNAPTQVFLRQSDRFEPGPTFGFHSPAQDEAFAALADVAGDARLELLFGGYHRELKAFQVGGDTAQECRLAGLPRDIDCQDLVAADFNGDLKSDLFLARTPWTFLETDLADRNIRLNWHSTGKRLSLQFLGAGGLKLRYSTPDRIPLIIGQRKPQRRLGVLHEIDSDRPEHRGLTPQEQRRFESGFFVGFRPESQTWELALVAPPGLMAEALVECEHAPEAVGVVPTATLNPERASLLLLRGENGWIPCASQCFRSPLQSVSAVAGDFDNDMDLDLYVVCTNAVSNRRNRLLENLGAGSWEDVEGAGGAEGTMEGVGDAVVTLDYDRDGFLDLAVTNGQGAGVLALGPLELFRNEGGDHHWIEIDLVGTSSNVEGIGAKVVLHAGGIRQLREQGGGTHSFSQNHSRLHFGLGGNERIDDLEILWPGGRRQRLSDLPADQVLRVTEPRD